MIVPGLRTHGLAQSPCLAGDIDWTFHPIGDTDHLNTGGTSKDSLLACCFVLDQKAVGFSARPNWLMPPPNVGERVRKEKMLVDLTELSNLGCHTSSMKAYKAQIRSLGSGLT